MQELNSRMALFRDIERFLQCLVGRAENGGRNEILTGLNTLRPPKTVDGKAIL